MDGVERKNRRSEAQQSPLGEAKRSRASSVGEARSKADCYYQEFSVE